MNRLQQELQHLYGPQDDACLEQDLDANGLCDAQARVRAMVLELARPADWPVLSMFTTLMNCLRLYLVGIVVIRGNKVCRSIHLWRERLSKSRKAMSGSVDFELALAPSE